MLVTTVPYNWPLWLWILSHTLTHYNVYSYIWSTVTATLLRWTEVFSFHSRYGRLCLYSHTYPHIFMLLFFPTNNQGGLVLQSCAIYPSHTHIHFLHSKRLISHMCLGLGKTNAHKPEKHCVWIDYYDDNNPHNCINYCRKEEIFITVVLVVEGTQPWLSCWLNFTPPDPYYLFEAAGPI